MQLVDALEQRVVELETRLSFQEHTIAELNDTVIVQQRELQALATRLKRLEEELRGLMQDVSAHDPQSEPPPPHY